MTTTKKAPRKSSARQDVYALVTERLLEQLDAGTIPWRKSWEGGEDGMPRSLNTGKVYRGVNLFLLSMVGSAYSSPYWLTFKQAKALGGSVRKGERGTMIVFWSTFQPKDANGKPEVDANGKKKGGMFLKRYTVFNLDQTDDVKVPKSRELASPSDSGNDGHAEDQAACGSARSIFDAYTDREAIGVSYGGGIAAFSPMIDAIRLPDVEAFETEEAHWATAMHEATHSTGIASRLNRPGIADFDFAGSHRYADEELVAEFGASFLCGVAGINRQDQIENAAAYIAGWKKRCQADPKLLVYAAQRAQKAADLILNVQAADEGGK